MNISKIKMLDNENEGDKKDGGVPDLIDSSISLLDADFEGKSNSVKYIYIYITLESRLLAPEFRFLVTSNVFNASENLEKNPNITFS